MTDSKQSALARRLAEKLNEYPTNTVNNLVETVNNLTQTTNNSIVQTQQQLENLKSYSEGTGSLLTYHLDLENSNSFNTRITNLENAPPSGGGGGIDPTDPEPVLISENYVSQMQNWANAGGSIQILSFNGYGEFVSPRIFQTLGTVVGFSGNNMYIVAAASETDHAGIIEIVVEDDVTGVLSLSSNATGTVCVPDDITRMIAIIKTPTSFPSTSSFIVGFATDLNAPTEGIYFVANPATNTWIPTVNNGSSTSTGTTTALATNTWYTLEISKVTSSSFDFTINGTTVNINTNVPTDPLNCGLWIDNAAGPSSTQLKVKLDFFSLKLRGDAGGVLPAGATVEGTLNEVDVAYNSTTQVYTVGLPNEVTVENLNVDSIDFDTAPATSNALARLQWDNDYKTVRLGMTSSINAPLGQSLYKRVRNSSNTTAINLGEVLYINGSQGATVLQVGLADASSELTAATTIGIAAENIAANGTGMIILQGLLTGLNTNAYSPGDLVWLSTTAGAWTTTRPTAPDHGVFLGWIVKSAGAPDGSIYVKVANGQELYELHDVKITSIANNDVLQWDNTDLRWENRSLATAGIAAASHTHPLSDITQSSAGLNQVPQWNGSNWVPVTLSTGGSPGGSTGQVQYNNASAFAGATNVKINSNNLELVKPATEPTTAPANSIVMYVKDLGHRDLPAFADSSGWSTNLQTCIARNKFTQFNFNGGTNAAAISNGMVLTTTSVGTAGTAGGTVALSSTSILGGSRRQTYLTSTTASSATGWRATAAQCWRGNGVGRGGFFCVWKFGIGDAVLTAGGTLFVGLNDSTSAPVVGVTQNPRTTTDNTMRNQVGLVLADGSLVYQICHRNGVTAATSISTGITANLTDIIEFCLYTPPNGTTIYYYLKVYADSGSNTEISGDIGTSNIPVNTTLFVPHMWRGNNLSATALAVHALAFSIETPH